MADRLTRITTRTGDDGTTGLGDGSRVGKDAPRIAVLGDLDELSSAIGCVIAQGLPEALATLLATIQNDLFDLGGDVSIPGRETLATAQLAHLDAAIETLRAPLPTLRDFVLPGGSRAAAACHLARAVSRRAERSLVALARVEPVSQLAQRYLNRLSDVLFLAARTLNAEAGHAEPIWTSRR